MKKILALALALMIATVGLTFAMAEEKQYYIGYSNMQRAEDFFITVADGLAKAAEENNVKLEETIANRDAVLMTQNIEAFLMKGVDMVIDFNVLAETGSEMAARCAEKGVPMISIDCLYDGAYFFGVDNYGAGTALRRRGGRAGREVRRGRRPSDLDRLPGGRRQDQQHDPRLAQQPSGRPQDRVRRPERRPRLRHQPGR